MTKETGLDRFYRVVIPKATSLGAALVVAGAMFKIEHWAGASVMLIVGLTTEAVIFLFGLFQPAAPIDTHYSWEKVYPELAQAGAKASTEKLKPMEKNKAVFGALTAIDKALSDGKFDVNTVKSFGQGVKKLNESVGHMKDMTEVSTASKEFKTNLIHSSKMVADLSTTFSNTNTAMQNFNTSAEMGKEYHEQLQKVTRNLGAMNAIYEMELKDANSHLKAMNRFYGNLTSALENMNDASKEAETFKSQISSLSKNLTSLNKVYGNMLNALKI